VFQNGRKSGSHREASDEQRRVVKDADMGMGVHAAFLALLKSASRLEMRLEMLMLKALV